MTQLMLMLMLALLQDPPEKAAFDKGVKHLKSKVSAGGWTRSDKDPDLDVPQTPARDEAHAELVLWTLVAAGVSTEDAALAKLLRLCADRPRWQTYNVALLAMALHRIDANAHRDLIAQCGQFFLDTQCKSGHWSYGSGYKPAPRRKFPAGPIKLKKGALPTGMELPNAGDFSNSQFAALGVRACLEAGVEFPEEMIRAAREAWVKGQLEDGSWGYRSEQFAPKGYATMTYGGVGATAFFSKLLKENAAENDTVLRGLDWISKNFSVETHPGFLRQPEGKIALFYYQLYAIERAGDLLGADKFGDHDWFARGCERLVKLQKPGGAWADPSTESELAATCFAVLFLARPTPPLEVKPGSRPRPGQIEARDKGK